MRSTRFRIALACAAVIAMLALGAGTAQAQVIYVSNLQPSWTTPGGVGVYAAYYHPNSDVAPPVSPGPTAHYAGRGAAIIKAGLLPDPADPLHYWDEGLLGFKVANVDIALFASQALSYDVQNETGPNPVWVRLRLVDGLGGDIQYQFVPTTNPASWHTVDAAAGGWQLMDDDGNATGLMMTLAQVAAANSGWTVIRVYLTMGMGDSYNVSPGVGTVGWVDKATLGGVTYDFVVTVPDTTPPTLVVPGDQTVEATSPAGAIVTFVATATDPLDPNPTVACDPASGGTFPIGTTTVSCTASDAAGNTSDAQTFNVKVQDTTPPKVTVPADIATTATSLSGAVVTFSPIPSAVDIVDGSRPTNCTRPTSITVVSGATFPIGTTTVTCTAADVAGNSATSSFKVIVNKCPAFDNEVAGMIETLIASVNAINLKKKDEKKLIHELDKTLKEVGQCDQKNACKGIEKFIKDVKKKKLDKHFDGGEEASLLLQANATKSKLGCS